MHFHWRWFIRAKSVRGAVGIWNGISFFLTHEHLSQSCWHFSLSVPLGMHFKSCAFPSLNWGLLQIQVEGSMNELPLATRLSGKPDHACTVYLHIPTWKLHFPSSPHTTCHHSFKGTECHGCLAMGSLFLQLFLTLVSLSTTGNGGDGKTSAQPEHVNRKNPHSGGRIVHPTQKI